MSHKPPVPFVNLNAIPVVDLTTGKMNPAWFGFFADLTSPSTPIETLTLDASPATYRAIHAGSLLLRGGFVTAISFTRARVTVDLAGAAGALGNASFSAYKSANQGGVGSATETKITFPNVEWDNGGYYTAASSLWTPPKGLIRLNAAVRFTSANMIDGGAAWVVFYKNGAAWKYGTLNFQGAAGTPITLATAIDEANGTDFYEVYATAGGAGNKTIQGGQTETYFQGSMIGGGSSGLGEFIPMSQNDEVEITYSDVPDAYFFPNGNPA